MVFGIAFSNVLVTLLYILPGFLLCKAKKATPAHLPTLSSVLVYVGTPCMILSSFLSLDYSTENLCHMGLFFVATFVLQAAFMLLITLLFHRRMKDSRYRLLTIGSVLGNVGFFGIPIMKALLPDNPEVMSYACIYAVSMNILAFTVGVFCLTGEKKYMTLRTALLNPTVLSFAVALPLYILKAGTFLPSLLTNALSLISSLTAPLCMMILGVRLAAASPKSLFTRPIVYLTAVCKLLIFPVFCYIGVCFLPLPFSFKASILILSGTPCAALIQSLAELHQSETELSANSVLVSTLVCFLTIPLLTLLLW